MQKKPYKIILISSGQPALNPRLVKEADALADAGYEVLVIYAYWNAWGDDFTKQLLLTKKWTAICTGGHPVEAPVTYFLSRLAFKFSRLAFTKLGMTTFYDAAISRCTPFLIREAKKHKADLYIGHNLGALPAVVKAAKKHHAKCGFDAEDFHRQETSDDQNSVNYLIAKSAEDRYYPALDYLSASSAEISQAYRQLYPQKGFHTIVNAFNPSETKSDYAATGKVKLFWFSQTIGRQRGLEDIAAAMKMLPTGNFEVHLLGYLPSSDDVFIKTLFAGIDMTFHEPIPPDEIIAFAGQFDIGLATEQKTPLNRDICLTNKLFTYLSAGLAIAATNTTAQSAFISQYPQVGELYIQQELGQLAGILSDYFNDPKKLRKAKEAAKKLSADKLNWKTESKSFLKLVNHTLAGN